MSRLSAINLPPLGIGHFLREAMTVSVSVESLLAKSLEEVDKAVG